MSGINAICSKSALLLAVVVLVSCGPSLIEPRSEARSPSGTASAEVLRLNYDATVPYIWQVRIAHEGGSPEEVAKIVDPVDVRIEWQKEDFLSVSYTGGRLADGNRTEYCTGLLVRHCTQINYLKVDAPLNTQP
jgi:P pilus assembly chaperone PapD